MAADGNTRPLAARAVGAMLGVTAAAYLLSLIIRNGSGFSWFWDVVVGTTSYALVAALLWLRAKSAPDDRAVYVLLACGATTYAVGNLAYGLSTWFEVEPTIPSLSDIGYLALLPCVFAALAVELRRTPGGFPLGVVLDGIMGALGRPPEWSC